MINIIRLSGLYAPTLKEVPSDAELASHRLLLRAGMMRKMGSGLYSFLPLGMRVLDKVRAIVEEEMDAIGAQKIVMPILQPAELWHESGRWEAYGPELMRIVDRHDANFCLGPTHEEIITALVRNELRSYKQLPLSLYQTQVKYRDEIRPRFGLMRSREFVMKDAYSFHATQESLQRTYDDMSGAYGRIMDRLGLQWRAVEADSGQIGGKVTCEFMALAEAGEAEIAHCPCGFAADAEAAECLCEPTLHDVPALERVHTPGVRTIAELAAFLGIPATSTVKALSGKDAEGALTVLFVPGDHELNDLKALQAVPGFTLLNDDEMSTFGLHKGSMGPVGLPEGARVVADRSLQAVASWVVGANEDDYHYVGARPGEHFEVSQWADLCQVRPGDRCPSCGLPLQGARGIEVGQVFQLGTRYSEALNATFMDEDGAERPFLMGCYGVGVTRAMAAVVEQCHDEQGIVWPSSVAPAQVCVIPLTVGDDLVQPAAERLAAELADLGIEVAIDDRSERAGVKFNDADLIGWPIQVVLGKRGLQAGTVEVKHRRTGARKDVALTSVAEAISFAHRAARTGAVSPDVYHLMFE
ncbi:proline--tRNA ligase [Berryella wangjianweii]|uniref:Proline--tRNA ligase n=1 Tax=Berryella wangjianweii TaxID=2734634 RepID=A0A6M8J0T3_9ACTN|nr:proline--tRNA ligase [Berryella wangjianweii]QKF07177.1 proline--tRNA ligase [Berryella wangjianweii]